MTFAASAGASRAPTSQQRAALTSAVQASSVGGINRIPRSHYRVTGPRVSSVSSSWATAQLTAQPAFRTTFQNAIIVAVRPAGTQRWVVVDLGSADVGCGIAPDKVLADLFKTKTPCPSGEGIG
jgi:hypothetical protein